MSSAAKIVGVPVDDIEILSALRGGPGVRSAVVIELVTDDGTTQVIGYVTGPDPAVGATRIRQHLAAQLPEYLMPDHVVVLADLPLTPTGEFDLGALPAPDPGSDVHVAPVTAVERELAAIFEEVLGLPDVGVHDSFFALGGSSIMATRLAARIREAFGVEVSLIDVLAAPTVDELATVVGECVSWPS